MCSNNKLKLISCSISAGSLFLCLIIAGCSNTFFSSRVTYKVPQEKLQQIETLELEELKSSEGQKVSIEDFDKKAPAELSLSIEECRALTLENNLDLKVQLIEPSIAAERVIEQEASRFEPEFSAIGTYSKINNPSSGFLDVISGNKVDTSNVRYNVEIPLRSGGTINVNFTDTRRKTDALNSRFNPVYSSDFGASISQPLLRNAGKQAAAYSIRLQEYGKQSTDALTKLQVINTIVDIDSSYWRLYAARRLLDVRKQDYRLTSDLLKETERLVDVGINPEIDLLRTRAELASKLQNIISAENTVRDQERILKRKLNKPALDMKTETELILSTLPDPVRYKFEKEHLIEIAMENRMDLLDLEIQLARDQSTIDYNRNQMHPSVYLDYEYGSSGLGASRHDSNEMLYDNNFRDHTVRLRLNVPIGNEAAESRLRQARYERMKRLTTKENKKDEIEYQVLRELDNLEARWQAIMAARQTTILRDEEYRSEKRQYELGMTKSTDVLLAQTNLAEAQRSEIFAITEYQVALIELARATGTLLDASRIEWEPIAIKN